MISRTMVAAVGALGLLALGFLSARAEANCEGARCTSAFSSNWSGTTSVSCSYGAAWSGGSNEGAADQLVMVGLDSGYCAKARGYDGYGNPLTNCQAVDYTADGATVYDNAGCTGAVKHRVYIGYHLN